jgi:uncharacterized protein YndB with AHSA1/START domain
MLIKIILGLVVIVGLFLIYVSTRDGKFHYERSGLIAAPPEKIFPLISNFKNGEQWSPYEKMDPTMKKTFSGPDGQVGSIMAFEGSKDVGSGELEILKLIPNEFVEIRLTMTKPFRADNIVQYRLTREGQETRFSWAMLGDGGFMGKLVTTFIDCEKMVAGQFGTGIQNLKTLVENSK